MRRVAGVALAVVLSMLAAAPAALAEKRIALLIGNQSYGGDIGRLANPHNDIALLERVLKGLGFDVAVERDASLGTLTRAVNAYARRVRAAGLDAVGFFYYSGHGAADGGTNYLIPVDVKTTETGELWDQSLRLTSITRQLKTEAGNAVHFVVFDACRNTLKLTKAGSRTVVQSKGFVPVSQESGMLIAYATAEGELASDVGAGAGPYAKVLAEEIVKPGIEAVYMFRRVQVRVRSTIGQEPWLGFSALGEVHLAGLETPKSAAVAPAPQASATIAKLSEAAEAWAATRDTTNAAVLEAFIARYKDTFYAELARARIEDVKRQAYLPARPEEVRDFEKSAGGTAYFFIDAKLLPEAEAIVSRQAMWLLDHPKLTVTVEGHDDARNSAGAAVALAAKRAETVREHLIGSGVDAARIKTVSRGNTRPVESCGNESCWAMNRRVQTILHSSERSENAANPKIANATPPTPVQTVPVRCDGVEAPVGDERRCLKPKESFKDCPECPEMVVVPAGEFTMGSPPNEEGHLENEGPQHKVTIARPFAVGRFEVTFAEWGKCVAAGGCKHTPDDSGWGQGKRPVINLSWHDAKEYAAWLSKTTGRAYRLLTEAEWEYAARAGTTTRYAFGARITKQQAQFSVVSWADAGRTVEVGAFAPNAFGIHDMHGNAWEWVEDCWHASYKGTPTDGSAWSTLCVEKDGVLRGGSWFHVPLNIRSANRGRDGRSNRLYDYGFRLARTLNP